MPRVFSKIELLLVALFGTFFVVVLPALHALPATVIRDGQEVANLWHITDVTLYQWAKYLCYALLAISVDILWGYTGLLSLGQASRA